MEELLIANSRAYAAQHQLQLAERLGFGIHGIIHAAEDKAKSGNTAIKAHRSAEPYQRERAAYERLSDACITQEQFGSLWPTVQAVLAELKRFGIHMIDVSPSNIAFVD